MHAAGSESVRNLTNGNENRQNLESFRCHIALVVWKCKPTDKS